MPTNHTKESLEAFSNRVKEAFLAKKIRSPVHFPSGNADRLLEIFKYIKSDDWIFCSWRNFWHCLLKGVPEDEVFNAILDNRSMYMMFAKHKIICSSIVAGIFPLALGVADGIKRLGGKEYVNVFSGDMAARTGLFFEFVQYWKGHDLPIRVIVENNGLSTDTPTEEAWGAPAIELCRNGILEYEYERTEPHVGLKDRVEF